MADRAQPTLPIALRRSFQLGATEVVWLGLGGWLVIGLFGLFDPILALAGRQASSAYLLHALVMVPALLSQLELRQSVRLAGGGYQLLRTLDRPALTFLGGWAYLLGWSGLAGLVAWSFAGHLGRLLQLVGLAADRLLIAAGFLLFFALLDATGRRPWWTLALRWSVLVGLGLALAGWAGAQAGGLSEPASDPGLGQPDTPFAAMATLGAVAWISEIVAERQPRLGLLRVGLLGWLVGPLLLAGLALVGGDLESIGAAALPGPGGALLLGAAAITTLLVWHPLSLIMLRQFQTLGDDGVLPAWLVPRSRYPRRLASLQLGLATVALILAARLLPDPRLAALALGNLAAVAFLLLQLGSTAASVVLGKKADGRRAGFRLPLYPVVPVTGAAVVVLLMAALPGWTRVAGLLWFGLGGLAFWQGGRQRLHEAQVDVTVFQELGAGTQLTSDYPVVVPIANPETARDLVRLAAAIARQREGHLLLLQVIRVDEHLALDAGRAEARRKLGLLEELLEQAESLGARAEGMTRLSRGVAQGILDTVADESARLVVIGSDVRLPAGSSGLGRVVDQVLAGAACAVAVVRGGWTPGLRRALVPVSMESEGLEAARLALATSPTGELRLVHIVRSGESSAAGEALLATIQGALGSRAQVVAEIQRASSAIEGILKAAAEADYIVLCEGDQGLLGEEPMGRLAAQLSVRAEKPLLLLRTSAALPTFVVRRAWRSLADLLPQLSREEQIAVYRNMRNAARPNVNYFVLITLSAVIASLGLLLSSPAVVIGAMLVAPLMSPIVATASGITFGDIRSLRDGLVATLQGMLAAITIGILVTALVPGAKATAEVLSRAQPTLLDLIVALASGMAGAYAIARKEVSEALPGVAIAAALLPPLASVGVGIALGEGAIAAGALLLFVTNLIAIIFAAALVFLLLGVRPPRVKERELRFRQGLAISVASLLVVSLPLAYFFWRTVDQNRTAGRARELVERSARTWGEVRLADLQIQQTGGRVSIQGTLYASGPIEAAALEQLGLELEEALRRPVALDLFVIPGQPMQRRPP